MKPLTIILITITCLFISSCGDKQENNNDNKQQSQTPSHEEKTPDAQIYRMVDEHKVLVLKDKGVAELTEPDGRTRPLTYTEENGMIRIELIVLGTPEIVYFKRIKDGLEDDGDIYYNPKEYKIIMKQVLAYRAQMELNKELHAALKSENVILFNQLLAKGAEIKPICKKENTNTLNFAIQARDPALVKRIIEAGAYIDPYIIYWSLTVNIYTKEKPRSNNDDEILQLLIDAKANVNSSRYRSTLPIDAAYNKGYYDAIRILIKSDGDIKKKYYRFTDEGKLLKRATLEKDRKNILGEWHWLSGYTEVYKSDGTWTSLRHKDGLKSNGTYKIEYDLIKDETKIINKDAKESWENIITEITANKITLKTRNLTANRITNVEKAQIKKMVKSVLYKNWWRTDRWVILLNENGTFISMAGNLGRDRKGKWTLNNRILKLVNKDLGTLYFFIDKIEQKELTLIGSRGTKTVLWAVTDTQHADFKKALMAKKWRENFKHKVNPKSLEIRKFLPNWKLHTDTHNGRKFITLTNGKWELWGDILYVEENKYFKTYDSYDITKITKDELHIHKHRFGKGYNYVWSAID